jgi:hypothetical protein
MTQGKIMQKTSDISQATTDCEIVSSRIFDTFWDIVYMAWITKMTPEQNQ